MTKKFIVTTTIYHPTESIVKFDELKDWRLIVVGDKKTPNDYTLKNGLYLSPEEQEKKYPELSKALGWNCIQRRNIGFVEAYNLGAEIIATVDDDNVPYEDWGKEVFIGKKIEVDFYESDEIAFDPLSVTEHNRYWHRGFPIQLVSKRNCKKSRKKITPLIQADFWDGDPDIDAFCRIIYQPNVKFKKFMPFAGQRISPFNSQNTFLSREVIPYYMVLPYIGRMDDIWGGYILQHYFPNSLIYNKATVLQDRHGHDLIKDLKGEYIGYENTYEFIQNLDNYENFLPGKTKIAYETYKNQFK